MVSEECGVAGDTPLCRLVAEALKRLTVLGYSRRSLYRYRTVWMHLVRFAAENNADEVLSADLLTRFVQEHSVPDSEVAGVGGHWRRHIAFSLKVLQDFCRHGRIERPFRYLHEIDLVPAMRKRLDEFEDYCRDKLHYRPNSLQNRIRELALFLEFLKSRNVAQIEQIQPGHVNEFVSSLRHLASRSISRIVSDLRGFFRFLLMRGVLRRDLSFALPTVRVPSDARIPSVWDAELVEQLLGAVDRSSPKGKRDYAILLLACRLGLRAGDIRRLQLGDLNWRESKVAITQSKTVAPLSLPLTEEIGEALIDYLKSGRPNSEHREVFLKLHAPFDPFATSHLYHIVTYWRRVAGVQFRCKQKRGLHSLRHSLATRLLNAGTPLATISEILGHTTLEATRIYAKADVEALRSVALDPEEVRDA